MEALDATRTYQLAAALFQILLATLIASTRVRAPIRVAIPLVLILNAVEALRDPLRTFGMLPTGGGPVATLDPAAIADPVIVMTLVFLLSQIPGPAGGPRAENAAFVAWVVASAGWAAFVLLVTAITGDPARVEPFKVFTHAGPFVGAAMILAGHVVPRWRALTPGPLRGQTLLLAGGIGVGLGVVAVSNLLDLPSGPPSNFARGALISSVAVFVLVAMASLSREAFVRGRKDARAFLALLALGLLLGAATNARGLNTQEFASQTLRPVLFATAVLRYDLVEVPRSARTILLPATAAMLAVSTFFGIHAIVTLQSVDVVPLGAAATVAVLALGAIVLRKPVGNALRESAGEAGSAVRIERYRLGLESTGPPYASPQLAALRKRLRITDEEHDTLVAVLESHVVVPARAIRGLQAGETVAGRFRVVRELGRGGQGRALLAEDGETGGFVVLKEAARPWEKDAPERVDSLRREAAAGTSVSSPRVARIVGVVEDAGVSYLVREHVPGRTLDLLVADSGPLSPSRARAVMLDVLDGLAAIHEAGLLHLDLKPSNVVLDENGRAVIIDLGTARRDAALPGITLTRGDVAGGTLGWMAPEHAAGGVVGRAADVYAAGALLSFLLTGRKPAHAAVALPDGAPGDVVRRACAVAPGARYADAREMREALSAA